MKTTSSELRKDVGNDMKGGTEVATSADRITSIGLCSPRPFSIQFFFVCCSVVRLHCCEEVEFSRKKLIPKDMDLCLRFQGKLLGTERNSPT